MLRPSQMYTDRLKEKYLSVWYDPFYMYYTLSHGMEQYVIPENNLGCHDFVSVDKDDNILGTIYYNVNYYAMSATNLGIIAFERMNPIFMKDLQQCIIDVFMKYNMNRLSFYAVLDNPAVRGYTNIVKRFGGQVVGIEHDTCKLIDGKLHDSISYEIMAKDFKEKYFAMLERKDMRNKRKGE